MTRKTKRRLFKMLFARRPRILARGDEQSSVRALSTLAGTLTVTAFIGYLDHLSGPDITLMPLYLLPVGLATWSISGIGGLLTAAAAVAMWLLCDLTSGRTFSHPSVPYWNGLLRGGVFATGVLLLSALRKQTRWLDAAVHEQTLALHQEIQMRKRIEGDASKALQAQKQNIADQLHDGLAPCLTAISLKSKYLEEELDAAFSPHAGLAGRIAVLLNDAIGQTRKVAQGLNTMEIDAHELVGALARLAAETEETHRVPCRLTTTIPTLVLPSETGLHLYLIAQQAIDNAIRHGRASHIDVGIHCDQAKLHLSVHDDGCGFTPADTNGTGLGLRLLRFRAGLLGGTATITSAPGNGTHIDVVMDVAPRLETHQAPLPQHRTRHTDDLHERT